MGEMENMKNHDPGRVPKRNLIWSRLVIGKTRAGQICCETHCEIEGSKQEVMFINSRQITGCEPTARVNCVLEISATQRPRRSLTGDSL